MDISSAIRNFKWTEEDKRFLVRFALFCAKETVIGDGQKVTDLMGREALKCVALVDNWLARQPVTAEQLHAAAYAAYKGDAANAAYKGDAASASAADAAAYAAYAATADAANAAAYAAYAAANAACAACAADAARRQQLEWLLDNAPKRFKAHLNMAMLGVPIS